MGLSPKLIDDLLERGYSRRHIARIGLGAAAVIPFFNEFAQAQQSEDELNAARGARGASGGGRGGRGGFGGGARQPYDPEVVRDLFQREPDGPQQRRSGGSLQSGAARMALLRHRATTSISKLNSSRAKT